jgi:hypothetical protein
MTIFGGYRTKMTVALILLAAALTGLPSRAKAGDYYPLSYYTTPDFIHAYDDNSPLVKQGFDMGFFVASGDPNKGKKICIGSREDALPDGCYGPLSFFGDDPETATVKDGAYLYEPVEIYVYDPCENKEWMVVTSEPLVFDPDYLGVFMEVEIDSLGYRVLRKWSDMKSDSNGFCDCYLVTYDPNDSNDPNYHCKPWDRNGDNLINLVDFSAAAGEGDWDPNYGQVGQAASSMYGYGLCFGFC